MKGSNTKPRRVQLTVLIPCYNEEAGIRQLIRSVPKLPWSYEILVVDGGSKDDTYGAAKSVGRKELRVIRYEKPRSKGYACAYGIDRAAGDVVVIQDADMNPKSIIPICKPLFEGKATFVNGSRLILPMEKGAMSTLNKLGNRMFALSVSMIIGQWLTDSLCGYKAFHTKLLKGRLKEDNWPDFEMIIKAKRLGAKIVEVPIRYNTRKFGEVKMQPIRHGWSMLKMLVKLAFSR
jgi:glycosyltransferase involved in cell wall biosynthesis